MFNERRVGSKPKLCARVMFAAAIIIDAGDNSCPGRRLPPWRKPNHETHTQTYPRQVKMGLAASKSIEFAPALCSPNPRHGQSECVLLGPCRGVGVTHMHLNLAWPFSSRRGPAEKAATSDAAPLTKCSTPPPA
jgi:hypothetical protein